MRPDPDDKPEQGEPVRPVWNEPVRSEPVRSEEEAGIGWGEAPEPDDDERLRRERPPHWDQ